MNAMWLERQMLDRGCLCDVRVCVQRVPPGRRQPGEGLHQPDLEMIKIGRDGGAAGAAGAATLQVWGNVAVRDAQAG